MGRAKRDPSTTIVAALISTTNPAPAVEAGEAVSWQRALLLPTGMPGGAHPMAHTSTGKLFF
jgi:hypothetical protein